MEFKKIHAPSSTDLFVDQLKTAILTGEYQVGDQLPSERELEKQLGVSRAVITAGLKRLQALHFIDIKPRYGAFIADYRKTGNLLTMNEIINFHGGHYRISLLRSIYRVRDQMESDIIRLAARHQDCGALRECRYALARLKNAETAPDQAEEYFSLMHALAVASGNDVYPLLVNNFRPIYLTLGRWTCENSHAQVFLQRTQHLVDLIDQGAEGEAVAYNTTLVKDNYRLLSGQDDLNLE